LKITLIYVPYNQDEYRQGMGLGPETLQAAGLVERLKEKDIQVSMERRLPEDLGGETQQERIARIEAALADLVSRSRSAGTLPVIVSGDCLSAIGVCAGLRRSIEAGGALSSEFGIAWFDAHGDFNTPETTMSGYLGGMPLACVCGRGLQELRTSSGLERPVRERHVMLLGVRDLDPPEKELLDSTPISALSPLEVRSGKVRQAADEHFQSVYGVYLHLDIDALDPVEAPAVNYLTPGGLTLEEVIEAGRTIGKTSPFLAVTLSALDPSLDAGGRTVETALQLLANLLAAD
jgi:arginase